MKLLRILATILSGPMLLIGIIWVLQGLNILPGSFRPARSSGPSTVRPWLWRAAGWSGGSTGAVKPGNGSFPPL